MVFIYFKPLYGKYFELIFQIKHNPEFAPMIRCTPVCLSLFRYRYHGQQPVTQAMTSVATHAATMLPILCININFSFDNWNPKSRLTYFTNRFREETTLIPFHKLVDCICTFVYIHFFSAVSSYCLIFKGEIVSFAFRGCY